MFKLTGEKYLCALKFIIIINTIRFGFKIIGTFKLIKGVNLKTINNQYVKPTFLKKKRKYKKYKENEKENIEKLKKCVNAEMKELFNENIIY